MSSEKQVKIDINVIKYLAKHKKVPVDSFLALSKPNDPFYIQANAVEKAEWVTSIWEKEGRPEIHPRGFHYRILGLGYRFTINNEEKEYQNTEQCWHYLLTGFKYARFLGLIPYDYVLDEKNPKPENISSFLSHEVFEPKNVDIDDDIYGLKFEPSLGFDDTDDFIENCIEETLNGVFESVNYYSKTEQPNYFEIWAEKGGVIPEDIAYEFNATTRPAGGGEFSVDMCYKAVYKAKQLRKDLHVFILTDFDPKGRDMPKSAARKIEKIASDFEVIAYAHHVGLTKEQCIKFSLPTVPAKKPKRDSSGAKGYITHTELFKKYAGQEPTELNAFQAREPEEYEKAIRDAISPYYDDTLDDKLQEELSRLKTDIRSKLKGEFANKKTELDELRKDLKEIIMEYKERTNKIKKKLKIAELIEKHSELYKIDVFKLIKDEKFNVPEAETEIPKNALLDTTRNYFEQIVKYKEFDIRWGVTTNNEKEHLNNHSNKNEKLPEKLKNWRKKNDGC